MELYEFEPCYLDFQYLKELVFEIDRIYIPEYIAAIRKQADKQNKAAS